MNIYSITNLLISISTVYADNPRSLNIEDNTLKLNTPSNVKEISHNYAELSKDNSAESSNERFMYPTSG
ncbi:MAG: hypothetical protein P1U74_07260, partial [Legionellaceae bacterium]|nr:hypothetical protein [Legionellaceae bacterium]